ALEDKAVLKDANVKVTVIEARGQVFSIFGAVKANGQYHIADPNMRVLDAITIANGAPKGVSVRVIRGKRSIRIPADRLAAGDAKFNIFIKPGVLIHGAEPQLKPISVVVGATGISIDGKPTSWTQVRKVLQDISAEERAQTYLALSSGSGDLPVRSYFEA